MKPIAIFFTFFTIALFHITKIEALKFYPPVVNFSIFLLFFSSLFSKETIIQKIAKKIDGELDKRALVYTRNLTYVWSIFLFLNFSISLLSVYLSDKIWIIYNGCISYVLVGMVFLVEYVVRIICLKNSTKQNTIMTLH